MLHSLADSDSSLKASKCISDIYQQHGLTHKRSRTHGCVGGPDPLMKDAGQGHQIFGPWFLLPRERVTVEFQLKGPVCK